MENYCIKGYITNLGKYVEGELIGKHVEFPVTKKELKKVLDEIGINEYYEEYFITDYDGNYPSCVYDMLGEYTPIETLNKIALALEKVCQAGVQEQFIAFLEHSNDIFGACANAINGNGLYISGSDYSDLAHFFIDETGGIENLSNETTQYYFDYDMFGRDIRIEFYNEDNPEQTAEEFYCSDENATDEEIGQAYIEMCGFESVANKEYYFDYEEYGRMMFTDGSYISTDNGYVDCSDYDDSLSEDFEKELEEELDEEKGEQIL